MSKNGVWWQMRFSKNVVNRGKGVVLGEVVENKRKINFKKCLIYPMLCDIMVL